MKEAMTKRDRQQHPPARNDTGARAREIIRRLKRLYPDAVTALGHSNPLELLIATVLSAQCTDERVNLVTPELFRQYREAKDYAAADLRDLEKAIRSTGFFRAKAKNILNCCLMLVERHGGKVPETMEELVQLPGVGRKTANVVLGSAFGKAAGVVVDTHVRRLSGRLGLSEANDPEAIEQDLIAILPRRDWIVFPHLLISHGRKICQARKPRCTECAVSDLCPAAAQFLAAQGQASGAHRAQVRRGANPEHVNILPTRPAGRPKSPRASRTTPRK